MHLASLELTDFRNIASASFVPDPAGVTVIGGLNGSGKTSLLEAVGYLATLQSFRGAHRDELVRRDRPRAVLRGSSVVGERTLSLEAEIPAEGRPRMMLNRQTVRRRGDLHEALRVTVFTPEDIGTVRGSPAARRRFLDETLAVVDPRSARVAEDVERILRQRTALVKQAGRRAGPDDVTTLDVWDERLATAGETLVGARRALIADLRPLVEHHYARLAGEATPVDLRYVPSWEGELAAALQAARREDLVRGVTTVGPHRDDLDLRIEGMSARTQASQGEQRSLALALQLAAHQLATDRLGSSPVLLLDDVFSELDPHRARALLGGVPPGQTLLTTAIPLPPEVQPARTYRFESGRLDEVPPADRRAG